MENSVIQIDAADLLKDLREVCKHRPMEVTVFTHGEQIPKSALLHLKYRVFDGYKFSLNVWLTV